MKAPRGPVRSLLALSLLAPSLRAGDPEETLAPAGPTLQTLALSTNWAQLPSLRDPEAEAPKGGGPDAIAPKGLDLQPLGVWRGSDVFPFLVGGLLGLTVHEAGHLGMGYALNAHPSTQSVHGGGASFFAITYGRDLTRREAYTLSSAGFLFQYASSEWILSRHPNLWQEDAPVAKGVFAFHIITSLVYAYSALAHTGPEARDTLGMADALGINERWVGAAVLVPALLDIYRSIHPEAAWARHASRSVKLGFVLAIAK